MPTVKTTNLLHAALLRALGATTEEVLPGPAGHGEVVLDVTHVTSTRARAEAEVLQQQLAQMPDQPTMDVVTRLVQNTFLGPMAAHHADLRAAILALKGRRR